VAHLFEFDWRAIPIGCYFNHDVVAHRTEEYAIYPYTPSNAVEWCWEMIIARYILLIQMIHHRLYK